MEQEKTIGKYRGKRTDGKGWAYGCLYIDPRPNGGEHYIIQGGFVPLEYVHVEWFKEVDPETVGNFANLKDWGGKSFDWWEGDVLDYCKERFPENEDRSIVVIVRHDGCLMLKFYRDGKPHLLDNEDEFIKHIDAFDKEFRVKLGNIHDNPNLLTDKQ